MKKTILIAIAIIVGFVLILFLAQSFIAPYSKKAREASISTNPTYKDWKKYDNTQYGYSLLYPPSWGSTTELSSGGIVLFSNPAFLKERLENPSGFNRENYAAIDSNLYVYGANTAGGPVTEDTDLTEFAANNFSGIVTPGKPIEIDRKKGIELTRNRIVLKKQYPFGMQNCPEPNQEDCFEQKGTTKQAWFHLSQGILMLEYDYGRGYGSPNYASQTFQQILDSLSFK